MMKKINVNAKARTPEAYQVTADLFADEATCQDKLHKELHVKGCVVNYPRKLVMVPGPYIHMDAASVGDWIVVGTDGVARVVKKDDFAALYDAAP